MPLLPGHVGCARMVTVLMQVARLSEEMLWLELLVHS